MQWRVDLIILNELIIICIMAIKSRGNAYRYFKAFNDALSATTEKYGVPHKQTHNNKY